MKRDIAAVREISIRSGNAAIKRRSILRYIIAQIRRVCRMSVRIARLRAGFKRHAKRELRYLSARLTCKTLARRSLLRFFRRAVPSLAPLGSPSRREPRHSGIPLLSPYLSPSPFSSFATCRSRTRARVYALSSALFSFSSLIPCPPPPRSFLSLLLSPALRAASRAVRSFA